MRLDELVIIFEGTTKLLKNDRMLIEISDDIINQHFGLQNISLFITTPEVQDN